ncbi:MAG: hypothetical protein LAT51_09250 [Flavobacteriaceae bacterium]|nr:hypothetical protein [Flavobacteriaceae bacterium]
MKKLLLIALLFVGFQFVQAQEKPISIDATVGLPMGDADDSSNLFLGVNFTYMFAEVAEDFYIGGRAGYNIYLGEDVDTGFGTLSVPDLDFATFAVVARFDFTENIFGRLDAGYALGFEDNVEGDSLGGVFIEPRVGYSTYDFDIFAFYQSIFDSEVTLGAVGVGFAYKF